jgi:hypothetical protein
MTRKIHLKYLEKIINRNEIRRRINPFKMPLNSRNETIDNNEWGNCIGICIK